MKEFIPTPSVSQFNFGPLTIHFYAVCIILGIFVAITIGKRRSPENSELLNEIAAYVIPSGILGARIYHVITTPEKYFNHNFLDAFKIWEGGLGIWGAIVGGAVGGYVALMKYGKSDQFLILADALAPGLLFAQAIGRLGNWFNGELYGKPTNLPWALRIPGSAQTYHPTFLYEAIWCFVGALFLLRSERLRKLASGKTFLLYVLIYTSGRGWIEALRIDNAHRIGGVRLNVWVSALVFATTLYFYLRKPKNSKVE